MSDEETATGVQLEERISNKNPLVSEEVPAMISKFGDSDNDDAKPSAVKEPPPPDHTPPNPPDSEPSDSGTSGQVVESSNTAVPSVGNGSNAQHITECATAWVIVSFVVCSFYTGVFVAFALTGDRIYQEFYSKVLLPTCWTAMAIAFALKPRRSDLPYMAFLSFQYLSCSIGSEILALLGFKWRKDKVLKGFLRSLIWFGMFLVALRARSSIARLSDADLSKFLSMSVIKGGLIVGLGQLIFLAFSSVQCLNEASVEDLNWTECKRSLFSQTGLGCLVAEYTILLLVSSLRGGEGDRVSQSSLAQCLGMNLLRAAHGGTWRHVL